MPSSEIPGMKICYRCRAFLPLSEFHIDRHAVDGRQALCKECAAETNRISRKRRKANWLRRQASSLQKIKNKIRRRTRALYSHGPCAVHNCNRPGEWHHLDYRDPGAFILLCSKHHGLLHIYQKILQEVAEGFYEDPMPGLRRRVHGPLGCLAVFLRLTWLRIRRLLFT